MILKIRDLIDILSVTETLLLTRLIKNNIQLDIDSHGISVIGNNKKLIVNKGIIEVDERSVVLIDPFRSIRFERDTDVHDDNDKRLYVMVRETSTSREIEMIPRGSRTSSVIIRRINDNLYERLLWMMEGLYIHESYIHNVHNTTIISSVSRSYVDSYIMDHSNSIRYKIEHDDLILDTNIELEDGIRSVLDVAIQIHLEKKMISGNLVAII